MPIFSTLLNSRVPIKLWTQTETIENDAVKQLENTANLPFVFKHVAVMPDVHLGIGATVGSVVATREAIVPACVGVDIGCGMMAVKTPLDHRIVRDKLPSLRKEIEQTIPLGFESNKRETKSVEMWQGWKDWRGLSPFADKDLHKKARLQLGSLGGGNHFIEICLDTKHNVWVMLHSGSRHVGNSLAMRHIKTAKSLIKQMAISLPDPNLAHFVEGTAEFKEYIRDLEWCQAYALQNRIEMMSRIMAICALVCNDGKPVPRNFEVNCHHNYVAREVHFNEQVYVTRKGAVRAQAGEFGIIPGSMGAKSYIVKGKGNPDAFNSCSHGAGRRMSRKQAKKQFKVGDLVRMTEGVECRKDKGVLDEIPAAYKNIDEVMANQTDLVEPIAELKQIVCVKG